MDPSVRGRSPESPAETAPPESEDEAAGRLESARARARDANARLNEARTRHVSIDASFCWLERERGLAASVLAGGIAYRLFFWLLPVSLVFGGALGFFSSDSAKGAAGHLGLTGTAVKAVGDAVSDTSEARWALLLIGIGGLLWTSSWSVVAFRRVFALIWGVPPPRGGNPLKDSIVFSGVLLLIVLIPALGAWLRSVSTGPGLLVEILALGAFFGIWLWVSDWLPHADAPLRALVPGAALAAVGLQIIHLLTVFYIAVRLDHATALYGGLGLAATFLFALWVIGRLIISSAILNTELWRRMRPDDDINSPG